MRLLGGFGVEVDGRPIALPPSVQRPLAALALNPYQHNRAVLGAMLYPDGRNKQVMASLRSALWRAKREAGSVLVDSRGDRLCLMDDVEVDLQKWVRRARVLTSQSRVDGLADCADLVDALSQELLPTWGEVWLALERQRWNLLRLHALEKLADRLAAGGRHLEALEAGLAAIAIEPYRESAHRAIIRTHLAEGNNASALAQYQRYQRLLMRELGMRPTAQLRALVENLTSE